MYYRSTITGKIMANISMVDDIYGNGEIARLVEKDIIEIIDNPTMEELLEHGTTVTIIHRYRQLHNCTLKEAKDEVEKLLNNYRSKYDDGTRMPLLASDEI